MLRAEVVEATRLVDDQAEDRPSNPRAVRLNVRRDSSARELVQAHFDVSRDTLQHLAIKDLAALVAALIAQLKGAGL
jgi:hypothetical protein